MVQTGNSSPERGSDSLKMAQPHANSQLIGKDPDAGKDRRQEEKGMTGDEMVG